MGFGVFEPKPLSSEGLLGLLAAAQRLLGLTTGSHPKYGCLCLDSDPRKRCSHIPQCRDSWGGLNDVCGPIPLLTGASPASAASGLVDRQDSLPCSEIIPNMSETARKICVTDVKGKEVLGSFPQRERSS